MAEALEVVFRSFWTWAGTLMLLAVLAEGIGNVIRKSS
jgi:hypothetical protein